MSWKDDIKKAVRGINGQGQELYSLICKVDSVDITNKTCYCIPLSEGGGDLQNVRLMSDNKIGFLIKPKIGSIVLVTMLNKATGYVSMFSEVDEILLNGDAYGGLVRIQELTNKINNLENAFNNFVTLYNLHTHGGVTSGPSATTPPVIANNTTLTPTQQAELENLTVKHGNGT